MKADQSNGIYSRFPISPPSIVGPPNCNPPAPDPQTLVADLGGSRGGVGVRCRGPGGAISPRLGPAGGSRRRGVIESGSGTADDGPYSRGTRPLMMRRLANGLIVSVPALA